MKETVSNDCKVMALCSQKGGVGKTTSCEIGRASCRERV